jgi:hypothetical protein
MRPRLLHPLRERPNGRPSRRGHERRAAPQRGTESRAPAGPVEPLASEGLALHCDPAVERARRAGGPLDNAVYTCGCGYLFSAAVSTTVVCPHCGCDQAW